MHRFFTLLRTLARAWLTNARVKEHPRHYIFGCGDSGIMTKNALQQEQKGRYKVVGFSDDNANRWGKQLQDIGIYAPSVVLNGDWLINQKINQLIIATQSITPERKREISELAIEAGVEVRIVPPYMKWIEGNISAKQLQTPPSIAFYVFEAVAE